MATKTSKPKTSKPKDRIDGTDRWTSKGYGIIPGPLTAEEKAKIAQLNKELAAQRKAKNSARKKGG